jgi:hypothetical protein
LRRPDCRGSAAATLPAKAAKPPTPLEVAFIDCVESIGVGLAPAPNVVAITAPGFVPVGAGTQLSPVRTDTNVPVIAISSADLVLTTDAGNALAQFIGTTLLTFPIIQQFNMFSSAHMSVRVVP